MVIWHGQVHIMHLPHLQLRPIMTRGRVYGHHGDDGERRKNRDLSFKAGCCSGSYSCVGISPNSPDFSFAISELRRPGEELPTI